MVPADCSDEAVGAPAGAALGIPSPAPLLGGLPAVASRDERIVEEGGPPAGRRPPPLPGEVVLLLPPRRPPDGVALAEMEPEARAEAVSRRSPPTPSAEEAGLCRGVSWLLFRCLAASRLMEGSRSAEGGEKWAPPSFRGSMVTGSCAQGVWAAWSRGPAKISVTWGQGPGQALPKTQGWAWLRRDIGAE